MTNHPYFIFTEGSIWHHHLYADEDASTLASTSTHVQYHESAKHRIARVHFSVSEG